MKKHEGMQSYSCKECPKKFYQKYALDDHVKLHHSTEPVLEISCPFDGCELTFVKKEYCRIHIARNHLNKSLEPLIEKKKDSKIHKCIPCSRDFNSYPAILYHTMDHMKENPIYKQQLLVI
jgi:DNA-directed RNA polymerase subunit RPC12/RpoP